MPSRLSEELGIVYVIKPADNEAGATGDSINMALYNDALFILQCGALTGDAVLTVKSGATDGVETTSETFKYRLADADQGSAGADNFGAYALSSSLTLTAATYDNRLLLIHVHAMDLTAGQPWITLALSAAASAHQSSCIALLSRARHFAHDMPSAI